MINFLNLINSLIKNRNETEILELLGIYLLVIESTSRCNLKCEMCPRNSFKYENGDVDLDSFKKISKYFTPKIIVNLTGWGEPLLHPKLIEIINIVKKKGAKVGFTTNATLLDNEVSEKLIRSNLDFIDFSIDGGTQDTYEQIRKGAKFYDVIHNIKNFIKIKETSGSKSPSTSITFVMMKKNIHELPLMVHLAKELKVDKLVAKNFNVLTNKEDIEHIVFSHGQYNELDNDFIKFRDNIIATTISAANNLNLNISINTFESNGSNICKLASTALFISHKGEVTICCAVGYPVPRMLDKTEILKNAKIIYGNINTSNLNNILQKKEYLECRANAIQGITPIECRGCLLSEGL